MRKNKPPQAYPGFRGTEAQRFWKRVKIADNGCWEWQGPTESSDGYGIFVLERKIPKQGSKHIRPHVWCYTKYVGGIPDGMQFDHLCRNRKCVNPLHLEPVTARTNVLRGKAPAADNSKKTQCIRGHPLSGENIIQYGNRRICKACRQRRNLLRRLKLSK